MEEVIKMQKIFYTVKGEGFPIVCVHGNGEDHRIFNKFIQQIEGHYQFVLIDSRYHGQSVNEGTLSYQTFCDDVKQVVDELGFDQYAVLGFSDGGIVALLLAMQDSRVQQIIALGANTSPKMIKAGYRFSMRVRLFCLLPFCIYNKKARKDFKLTRLMLREPSLSRSDLESIKVPTLLIFGEYDIFKKEEIQMMAKSIPYCVLKEIKKGGHYLLKDSLKQIVRETDLFLEACHQEDEYGDM